LRTENLFSTPNSAVLEAPEEIYAPAPTGPRRRSRQQEESPRASSRRDFDGDFASNLPDTSYADDDSDSRRRKGGYRLRLNGRALQVPKTLWGRIFSGIAFVLFLGVCAAVLAAVRSFFLHDPRFTVSSSSAIQSTGNTHVSRAQLLSIFGEDVERNIFNIPLGERRAELESLPWVQRATVMRLLPNHIRISITERTPVAFVRQGTQIGMVDGSGVLLDMPADAPGDPHFSFPVVTGISSADPLSTRAARMKIYAAFTGDLDSTGTHISEKLSEVDLSNPEDVKALIPDGSADILVHFGDTDFLARYQRFQDHLHEWLTDHPKLASVDMRYERQVVLQMQPGASTATAPAAPASNTPATAVAVSPPKPAIKLAPKPQTVVVKKSASKPAVSPSQTAKSPAAAKPATSNTEAWHMVVVKPHTKEAAALATKVKSAPLNHPQADTR
jgi:cell division protein FtsQ